MQTTTSDDGLLEHVTLTGDKNTKYTFELTNPLNLSHAPSAFLRQCFSGLLYLSRRLVEHGVEYKLHEEKPWDVGAAFPLDRSFDAISKTRENLNKTGSLKSRRAIVGGLLLW